MGKRPETKETVLLALELLKRIPRHSKITAKALFEQMESSGIQRDLRTIQRQLDMLSEHFNIERDDRSRPYGYRWGDRAPGFVVPNLNPQESLLLALAERQLQRLLPASVASFLSPFFQQASENLARQRSSQQSAAWMRKVRVVSETQPLIPPKIESSVFEAVSNALYQERWLDVRYRNSKGKQTSTRVMPLGLAQQGPRMYLVCRFFGYDAERTLVLHRIKSATVSNLEFEYPADFDLQSFDEQGQMGFGPGHLIQLKLNMAAPAAAHLDESPLSKDQVIKPLEGDRVQVSATVRDTAQLDWWVRAFGDQISNVEKVPVV